MSILPVSSGATAVSDIAHQLAADLPNLLLVLAGIFSVVFVLKTLRKWMFEGGKPAVGESHMFAGSDPGGDTKWRNFVRDNERAIREADDAIAENRRLMRRL